MTPVDIYLVLIRKKYLIFKTYFIAFEELFFIPLVFQPGPKVMLIWKVFSWSTLLLSEDLLREACLNVSDPITQL